MSSADTDKITKADTGKTIQTDTVNITKADTGKTAQPDTGKVAKADTERQSRYTKSQRIAAWTGIFLLAALYILTLISAVITSPAAPALFRGCLFASVLIPLVIFCYIKLGRLLSGR